jgi:hypothetical protein
MFGCLGGLVLLQQSKRQIVLSFPGARVHPHGRLERPHGTSDLMALAEPSPKCVVGGDGGFGLYSPVKVGWSFARGRDLTCCEGTEEEREDTTNNAGSHC